MKRRPGFTLIEILIVITIIGILSSLLIVGISKLKVSANRQQTRQLLQNCEALYNEYDATTHIHMDTFTLPSPGNVTAEMEAQYELANPTAPEGDRVGLMPVVTRALFTQMRSLPNIRAGMDKFPAGRMFLTRTGTGHYINYGLGDNWASGRNYIAGIGDVQYALPNSGLPTVGYLCIHTHVSSDGTFVATPGGAPIPPNGPPNTGCWFSLLGDPTVPILLDAWGNPIIVVLGGMMGQVPNGTQYNGTGGVSGFMYAGGNQTQARSPDGRIFFASAGPDGDFSKGDDNIYSYDAH